MENNDRSEISYWYDQENVLTVPTSKVPKEGEKIYFNTGMDPEWYDKNFPNRKLFNEGIRGEFIVTQVKRYYKNYDKIADVTAVEHYRMPSQYCVETFEVSIEKV